MFSLDPFYMWQRCSLLLSRLIALDLDFVNTTTRNVTIESVLLEDDEVWKG